MTTKEQRDEWRKLNGQGVTSAIGEYTPAEFWTLLDQIDALEAELDELEKDYNELHRDLHGRYAP